MFSASHFNSLSCVGVLNTPVQKMLLQRAQEKQGEFSNLEIRGLHLKSENTKLSFRFFPFIYARSSLGLLKALPTFSSININIFYIDNLTLSADISKFGKDHHRHVSKQSILFINRNMLQYNGFAHHKHTE